MVVKVLPTMMKVLSTKVGNTGYRRVGIEGPPMSAAALTWFYVTGEWLGYTVT